MRKYVVLNVNGKNVDVQPYQLVDVIRVSGDLAVWSTDVDGVVITTTDTFKKGEWVSGKEVYSEINYCVGMEEI